MRFVSYAQNFEDVMLWRALKQVRNGFYIDVGANHPIKESVTKAFYDHGWTGINIEPEEQLYNLLKQARPRDINLNVAISANTKLIDFYVSKHRGLHTTSETASNFLKKKDFLSEHRQVKAFTLDDICDKHSVKEIHFLKIDVEGAEKDVIESCTFTRFRPWIVVIEATKPLSQVDVSTEWEHILLNHNYVLSYFDGLNKYYVANEHSNLLENLKTPPNVFDEFLLTKDSFFIPASWNHEAKKKETLGENIHIQSGETMNSKIKEITKKIIIKSINWSPKLKSFLLKTLVEYNDITLSDNNDKALLPSIIYNNEGELPTLENPTSQLCTANQIYSRTYQKWIYEMKELPRLHRKEWEWVYIAEVLSQNGMLQTGKKGLGFGCGLEPLPLLFAKYGAHITVTDMEEGGAVDAGWAQTDQHIKNIENLFDNRPNIISSKEQFLERCDFKVADMNNIPSDLNNYDFTWSSCAFEHLGSIRHGLDFVKNSIKCLKPGGIAVHTTEFNLSSNEDTLEHPLASIFRLKDLQLLKKELEDEGYTMFPINTSVGTDKPDKHVDLPPYRQDIHLKLLLDQYVSTSIGIIIKKQ